MHYSAAINQVKRFPGRSRYALRLLDNLRDDGHVPNVITYTAAICVLAKASKADEAINLLNQVCDVRVCVSVCVCV